MQETAEAGLEIATPGVDPTELGQVVGALVAGDDNRVLAVDRDHSAEAGQSIILAEHVVGKIGTDLADDASDQSCYEQA